MRRLTRSSLLAAVAGAVLACTCFAVPAQAATASDADTFKTALAGKDDTITLEANVDLSEPVVITRSVTIDGGGNTITNSCTATTGGEKNALNISGDVQVTIKNVTIVDKNGGNVLTALESADVTLQNVTLDHSQSSAGAALIVNDCSTVTMFGCSIKLGPDSWGGVAMEDQGSQVTLGNPTVSGDAGKALVYVDNPASGEDITDYVKDVDDGSYVVGPITDGKNKPALVSSVWTVSSQAEFQAALDNAPADMMIKLGSDISVNGNGLYAANKKNLIIDGNNHTITATGLAAGAHGGADRAALSLVNSENSQVTNLKVVNVSGENNNGINVWGGSARLASVTLDHKADGGAPVIVAAGANVTVDGSFSATIGAGSWGVMNVDTTDGASKVSFTENVAASFDVTANPDAPIVYIDADNGHSLDTVVSGEENAGLMFTGNGTAVKLPVVTFVVDGKTVGTLTANADGTADFTGIWEILGPQTPDGKLFDGWYADADYTQVFDGNAPVSEDMTLYGRWIDQPIEITFMVGDEPYYMAQIFPGETLADNLPKDPVWEGHTFAGWYAQLAEDGKTVVPESKVDPEKTVFEASTTLYAGFVTAGDSTPVASGADEKPSGLPKTSDVVSFLPAIIAGAAGVTAAAGAVVLRKRSK